MPYDLRESGFVITITAMRERYDNATAIIADLHHLPGLNVKPLKHFLENPDGRGLAWSPHRAESSKYDGILLLDREHQRELGLLFHCANLIHWRQLCKSCCVLCAQSSAPDQFEPTWLRAYMYTHTHTHTHTHTRIRTHARTHTRTHTFTHTR